jgi:hypothetical protein
MSDPSVEPLARFAVRTLSRSCRCLSFRYGLSLPGHNDRDRGIFSCSLPCRRTGSSPSISTSSLPTSRAAPFPDSRIGYRLAYGGRIRSKCLELAKSEEAFAGRLVRDLNDSDDTCFVLCEVGQDSVFSFPDSGISTPRNAASFISRDLKL